MKQLVIFTDGVATNVIYDQSVADDITADPRFVNYAPQYNGTGGAWVMQGFDPASCGGFSRNDINTHVVYTEYTIPTVGTDNDDRFWMIDSYLKDDAKRNLASCASDPASFYSTDRPEEIYAAVNEIYGSVAHSVVRLTQ